MGTPRRLLLATFFPLLTLSPLAAQAPDSISTVAGGGGPSTFSTSICVPTYFDWIYQVNYYVKSCNSDLTHKANARRNEQRSLVTGENA
jgi:hypothetical protein